MKKKRKKYEQILIFLLTSETSGDNIQNMSGNSYYKKPIPIIERSK